MFWRTQEPIQMDPDAQSSEPDKSTVPSPYPGMPKGLLPTESSSDGFLLEMQKTFILVPHLYIGYGYKVLNCNQKLSKTATPTGSAMRVILSGTIADPPIVAGR